MKQKKAPVRRFPRRKPKPYRPERLSHTDYYEEKSLVEVCGGGCLKEATIFDKIKDDPTQLTRAVARAEFTRANNARPPRDLPDDWKQDMDPKKFGL